VLIIVYSAEIVTQTEPYMDGAPHNNPKTSCA